MRLRKVFEPCLRAIFYALLKPLILRNYRLRMEGKRPDEWYWADRVASHFGYFVLVTYARQPEQLLSEDSANSAVSLKEQLDTSS